MAQFRLTRWQPEPALALVRRRGDAWLAASSAIAAQDARRRAPVRTGRLRRSIVPLQLRPDRSGSRAGVWARAPYALWVEIGTRRMRAQPYLRPALTTVRAAAHLLISRIRVGVQ